MRVKWMTAGVSAAVLSAAMTLAAAADRAGNPDYQPTEHYLCAKGYTVDFALSKRMDAPDHPDLEKTATISVKGGPLQVLTLEVSPRGMVWYSNGAYEFVRGEKQYTAVPYGDGEGELTIKSANIAKYIFARCKRQ